jgi:hypothetical protein
VLEAVHERLAVPRLEHRLVIGDVAAARQPGPYSQPSARSSSSSEPAIASSNFIVIDPDGNPILVDQHV